MGDVDQRIKDMFLVDKYPDEGIFPVNLFIRGRPMTITVDDYIPLYNGKLIFLNTSAKTGNFWAALLEKVFAKLTGNYEQVNYGW